MLDKPQHLSAEQIIDRLRDTGSGVSKATVYNTLNLFAERGVVKECMVDPVRKFYDSSTHPHHHFYNVDTGDSVHVDFHAAAYEPGSVDDIWIAGDGGVWKSTNAGKPPAVTSRLGSFARSLCTTPCACSRRSSRSAWRK